MSMEQLTNTVHMRLGLYGAMRWEKLAVGRRKKAPDMSAAQPVSHRRMLEMMSKNRLAERIYDFTDMMTNLPGMQSITLGCLKEMEKEQLVEYELEALEKLIYLMLFRIDHPALIRLLMLAHMQEDVIACCGEGLPGQREADEDEVLECSRLIEYGLVVPQRLCSTGENSWYVLRIPQELRRIYVAYEDELLSRYYAANVINCCVQAAARLHRVVSCADVKHMIMRYEEPMANGAESVGRHAVGGQAIIDRLLQRAREDGDMPAYRSFGRIRRGIAEGLGRMTTAEFTAIAVFTAGAPMDEEGRPSTHLCREVQGEIYVAADELFCALGGSEAKLMEYIGRINDDRRMRHPYMPGRYSEFMKYVPGLNLDDTPAAQAIRMLAKRLEPHLPKDASEAAEGCTKAQAALDAAIMCHDVLQAGGDPTHMLQLRGINAAAQCPQWMEELFEEIEDRMRQPKRFGYPAE